MLASLNDLLKVPGMSAVSADFLAESLEGADKAVKEYCKRDLEETDYTEYYSGNNQRDLVLRQRPVESSTGLAVYVDPTGYYGDNPSGGFTAASLLTLGIDYVLVRDKGAVSKCAILRRLGSFLYGNFAGVYPQTYLTGKLAASKLPSWPTGAGNIKVTYTAGYATIPADLKNAVLMLAAWYVRAMPQGGPLQSETLGSYSYTIMTEALKSNAPMLGTISRTLARYREVTF